MYSVVSMEDSKHAVLKLPVALLGHQGALALAVAYGLGVEQRSCGRRGCLSPGLSASLGRGLEHQLGLSIHEVAAAEHGGSLVQGWQIGTPRCGYPRL